MPAWDNDIPQAPNIAGAGNYADMLFKSISGLGRPQQQQQQQRPQPQPQPQPAASPATPSGNIFTSPFLGGGTGGSGQPNYLQQLIAALSGRSGGP